MGSIKSSQTKRGCFGKVTASLNEKLENVEWGEVKFNDDLFDVCKVKRKLSKAELDAHGCVPVYSSESTNNGIIGYTNQRPEFLINKENHIYVVFGDHTRSFNIAKSSFCVADNTKVLKVKNHKISDKSLMFISSSWKKSIPDKGYSRHWSIAQRVVFKLPIKDGKPDFEFMESFIAELEAERIAELEAYLEVTGLSDCELTEDEQKALNKIGNVEWGEFKVGDLFEKLTLRNKNSNFNKLTDTSKVQSDEFDLPLVNAKVGDNGIMFYGRSEDFESEEMTIDVISNGAIATGTVYAQPQKTGVLWDAYLLKSKFITINKSQLIYLSASLQKSIKLKFGWEYKAVWSKVQKESIQLPVKDGKPDFEIMTQFISAIQKIVIKDVVVYADKKIQAHKEVIHS
ncbi:TPA: restriction endonuclease subunit S [Vibrio vulnificus]